MIQVERISVRLGRRRVLDEVSLSLERRQIVGIIGPPESGKSTLLKTMAGLIEPTHGEISAAGNRVDRVAPAQRRQWQHRIGMAFQNDALFDALTVFENVAFPLRRRRCPEDEIFRRVQVRLGDVGLLDAREKLPSEISGGMRKRVGVARATVIDPELGLFDQPTAGLDPVSSARILDLIVGLTASLEMATVVVSTDLAVLLPICHRVLMLHAGRVVYDGAPGGLTSSSSPEVVQFATGADEGPL